MRVIALAAAAVAAAFVAAWVLAPFFVDDPLETLSRRTPVRVYLDSSGATSRVERTWNHQWRFDTPLSEISPHVTAIILATEDSRFYSHHGVDYLATLRAAWQDLTSMRIVSGSSTISMQLAGLSDEMRRRTLPWKFKQAAQARLLERRYTKERILAEYLNRIPMGGQVYGIEAASRYYFGRPAADLNISEAALLCGIPQSPARFRPDRHREAALRRMGIVLRLYERQGGVTRDEAERIRREERLRFRDFSRPFDLRLMERGGTGTFFWNMAKREAGGDGAPQTVRTTLDSQLQAGAVAALRRGIEGLQGVSDGAAIVVDNASGAILAYVGTVDFDAVPGGQVDAAAATRSAGSALKPFIYAEAIEGGLLVAESYVLDAPTRYGAYMPVNYDGSYKGLVKATDALSSSLNTPAVRLLAQLGEDRMLGLMERLDLLSSRGVEWNGLALALGSAGHTLRDISGAYVCLAREGETIRLHALKATEAPAGCKRIFSRGTCAMTASMLRTPLPGTAVDCAWKTGTSHGNLDAWCFAFTPRHTVGVWIGNKDGSMSPALVGVTAAAPVAAEIMNIACAGAPPPVWPGPGERFDIVELCSATGLRRAANCAGGFQGYAPKGIPTKACEVCAGIMPASTFKIVHPVPGKYSAGGKEAARLVVEATAPAYWFDNAVPLGRHDGSWEHDFEPGQHLITASPDSGEPDSAVSITVGTGM